MSDWYITPNEYEIAESNGISKDTLEHRIRYLAWDKQRAITEPLRHLKNKERTKWLEVAVKNGLSKQSFYNRINKMGWSFEKAATTTKDYRKKYPEWVYNRLKENNISYTTFTRRIKYGWDIERASSEPVWSSTDALAKGRRIQKEQGIGPYRFAREFWEVERAKSVQAK